MERISFTKPPFRWLFGGVGFHQSEATMTPLMSEDFKNERVLKTYRELSPTFARLFAGFADWTREAMDRFADYYHETFAENDCSLYLVPGRMPILETEAEEREFAENVAERLEYLVKDRGCRLIRYYCCANELSVGNVYARLAGDLEKFKRIQTELWRAFRRHGLENIGLTATDASGFGAIGQLEWASKNMDDVTAVYCLHNYGTNGCRYDDPEFYDYVNGSVAAAVALAKKREKRFILGEFGIHSGGMRSPVMVNDVPDGFGDPRGEAESALMTCVEACAAMNAGALACAYWTLIDYPDPFLPDDGHSPESEIRHEVARFSGHGTAIRYNKNGLIRWSEDGDFTPRAYYFSLGLMARYFSKNSRLLTPEASDRRLICTGATNGDGSVSLCVINLAGETIAVGLESEHTVDKPYRVYRYECEHPIANELGDLPGYVALVCPDKDGALTLELPPHSLTILTTDYVERTPSPIGDITVTENSISWAHTADPEHRYYRVFEDGIQLGSTVADRLSRKTKPGAVYTVKSVDKYGNI